VIINLHLLIFIYNVNQFSPRTPCMQYVSNFESESKTGIFHESAGVIAENRNYRTLLCFYIYIFYIASLSSQ